ncbi:MAG: hypothetical protein PHG73_04755, partial [Pygmaiobacter sp.]|nr:hypothetical protein [Pygmaiobacter sp.]
VEEQTVFGSSWHTEPVGVTLGRGDGWSTDVTTDKDEGNILIASAPSRALRDGETVRVIADDT